MTLRRVVAVGGQRQQIGVAVNVIPHPRIGAGVIRGHVIVKVQALGDFVVLQPRENMHPIGADVGGHPRIIHRNHRVGGVKLARFVDRALHLEFEHLAQPRVQNLQPVARRKFIHGGHARLPQQIHQQGALVHRRALLLHEGSQRARG